VCCVLFAGRPPARHLVHGGITSIHDAMMPLPSFPQPPLSPSHPSLCHAAALDDSARHTPHTVIRGRVSAACVAAVAVGCLLGSGVQPLQPHSTTSGPLCRVHTPTSAFATYRTALLAWRHETHATT
jgi:hypothetical protein